MPSVPDTDLALSLLAVAAFVIAGRAAGDLARRLGQPEILGQLFVGFLLGPSVFGAILPSIYQTIIHNTTVVAAIAVFAWLGAVLRLLLGGTEINLTVLRRQVRPSALAALGAIVPSLIVGAVFAKLYFGASGYFLGLVLSVTAAGSISAILVEHGDMERRFAQVILAAGVASEVFVWLLVSVVATPNQHSPIVSLAVGTAKALGFFVLALTVGRRALNWSMRRVADVAVLRDGRLSLILSITLLSAVSTQLLGLHALLGAFVFGLLLGLAPRYSNPLPQRLNALTEAFFAPVFFVSAGTRIDLSHLQIGQAVVGVVALLVVASLVKVGFATLGARLGGLRGWTALTVGVGLNLKGSTDVIVAIVGVELHLFTVEAYTVYAVVAMLTVVLTPPVLAWLGPKTQPTASERKELERAAVERRAYVARLQRVLLPQVPQLQPMLTAEIAEVAAVARERVGESVDLVEVVPKVDSDGVDLDTSVSEVLGRLKSERRIHVLRQEIGSDIVESLLEIARPGDLISIGARPPTLQKAFTLGPLQDEVLRNRLVDVMATVSASETFECDKVRRILVPVNGLEYSMAGADIAGLMAAACDADAVLLSVVQPPTTQSRSSDYPRLRDAGESIIQEARTRLKRFEIPIAERVRVSDDVAGEILRELAIGTYQLIVLGGTERGHADTLYLGRTIEKVLLQTQIPAILLVARRTTPAIENEVA